MTTTSITYSSATHPYVEGTLHPFFFDLPEDPSTLDAALQGPQVKFYLPKVDDLLEAVRRNRPILLSSLLQSRLFDPYAKGRDGKTLTLVIIEKGDDKWTYIDLLMQCGIDLSLLGDERALLKGASSRQRQTLTAYKTKIAAAKELETSVLKTLQQTDRMKKISPFQVHLIGNRVSKGLPFINLERLLNEALSDTCNYAAVNKLLSLGANPNRCPRAFHYLFVLGHPTYRHLDNHHNFEALAGELHPGRTFPSHVSCRHVANTIDRITSGEHDLLFRHYLCALFAEEDFALTLDDFPKPNASIGKDSAEYLFNLVYENYQMVSQKKPLVFSMMDLPITATHPKWVQLCSDPTNPCILLSGWKMHSAVYVLFNSTMYRGNRSPSSRSIAPGIYRGTYNPKLLSPTLITRIVDNTSPATFESSFPTIMKCKDLTLHSPHKGQKIGNCTWASSVELSLEILYLIQGKTPDEAKALMKEKRIETRASLLQKYLTMDRSADPYLHSPALLGLILGKCIRKGQTNPHYHEMATSILLGPLSVDIFETLSHLTSKLGTPDQVIKRMHGFLPAPVKTHSLFIECDPFYTGEEKRYRESLALNSLSPRKQLWGDAQDLAFWICCDKIPLDYRLALAQKLFTPITSYILLLSPLRTKLPSVIRKQLLSHVASTTPAPLLDLARDPSSAPSFLQELCNGAELHKKEWLEEFVKHSLDIENKRLSGVHSLSTEQLAIWDLFLNLLLASPDSAFLCVKHSWDSPLVYAKLRTLATTMEKRFPFDALPKDVEHYFPFLLHFFSPASSFSYEDKTTLFLELFESSPAIRDSLLLTLLDNNMLPHSDTHKTLALDLFTSLADRDLAFIEDYLARHLRSYLLPDLRRQSETLCLLIKVATEARPSFIRRHLRAYKDIKSLWPPDVKEILSRILGAERFPTMSRDQILFFWIETPYSGTPEEKEIVDAFFCSYGFMARAKREQDSPELLPLKRRK